MAVDGQPGLTFIHGHAQTSEFVLQAQLFAHLRDTPLVRTSTLLLENNHELISQAFLEAVLELYPHEPRLLLRSANDGGYTCSQLNTLARHLRDDDGVGWWWRREWVIMMTPDVIPTARGVHVLYSILATHPRAAFVVSPWHRRRGCYHTDLIVFRPSRFGGRNVFADACANTPSNTLSNAPPSTGSNPGPNTTTTAPITEAVYRKLVRTWTSGGALPGRNLSYALMERHVARFSTEKRPDAAGWMHSGTLLTTWAGLNASDMRIPFAVRGLAFMLFGDTIFVPQPADAKSSEHSWRLLNRTCAQARTSTSAECWQDAVAGYFAVEDAFAPAAGTTAVPPTRNPDGHPGVHDPGGGGSSTSRGTSHLGSRQHIQRRLVLDAQMCGVRYATIDAAKRACTRRRWCMGFTAHGPLGCWFARGDDGPDAQPVFTLPRHLVPERAHHTTR